VPIANVTARMGRDLPHASTSWSDALRWTRSRSTAFGQQTLPCGLLEQGSANVRRDADVAQLAEQLFCKQQVARSIRAVGSNSNRT
jgi:hypothetical protein